MLGSAPSIADSIVDQLSRPADKANQAGEACGGPCGGPHGGLIGGPFSGPFSGPCYKLQKVILIHRTFHTSTHTGISRPSLLKSTATEVSKVLHFCRHLHPSTLCHTFACIHNFPRRHVSPAVFGSRGQQDVRGGVAGNVAPAAHPPAPLLHLRHGRAAQPQPGPGAPVLTASSVILSRISDRVLLPASTPLVWKSYSTSTCLRCAPLKCVAGRLVPCASGP